MTNKRKRSDPDSIKSQIKRVLRFPTDISHIKWFISEHIRGIIRTYGIAGPWNEKWLVFMYEVLFRDPITTRHFGQFQGMWQHRDPTSATRGSPEKEWWSTFNAYLSHCCEKVERANNRFHRWKQSQYLMGAADFYDSPAFNWADITAAEGNQPRWFPVTGVTKTLDPIPDDMLTNARSAQMAAAPSAVVDRPPRKVARVWIVHPENPEDTPNGPGLNPLWYWNQDEDEHQEPKSFLLTIMSYSLSTLWAVVREGLARIDQQYNPQALYGCPFRPVHRSAVVDAGKTPTAAQEKIANLRGQTYFPDLSVAAELTNDASVQRWLESSTGVIRAIICMSAGRTTG